MRQAILVIVIRNGEGASLHRELLAGKQSGLALGVARLLGLAA